MSSDDISPNNDENGKEAEKVSLLFVDSLFQDVQTKIHDDVDPLNIKRSSIQNREEQNKDNLPSSSSIKTPKKKLFENQLTNTKSSKKPYYIHSIQTKIFIKIQQNLIIILLKEIYFQIVNITFQKIT